MTISYELTEQLRGAGFPQPNDFPGYVPGTNPEIDLFLKNHPAYKPTLEELIDACEWDFKSLYWDARSRIWTATTETIVPQSEGEKIINGDGQTPEAAAKLWLALHAV